MTAAVTADVVAFYIYLTKTERNAGLRHVIVYVNVITNSGNRYNKHSGALTAPEAGKYGLPCTSLLSHIHIFQSNSLSTITELV